MTEPFDILWGCSYIPELVYNQIMRERLEKIMLMRWYKKKRNKKW